MKLKKLIKIADQSYTGTRIADQFDADGELRDYADAGLPRDPLAMAIANVLADAYDADLGDTLGQLRMAYTRLETMTTEVMKVKTRISVEIDDYTRRQVKREAKRERKTQSRGGKKQ